MSTTSRYSRGTSDAIARALETVNGEENEE